MRVSFNPIAKYNSFNKMPKAEIGSKKTPNANVLGTLECIATNNIAFCAINSPQAIYAISRDNEILKFESKTAASEVLDCNFVSITKCLAGKFYESNGYAFIHAKDIEIKKEDGSIELDEKVIKKGKMIVKEVNDTVMEIFNITGFVDILTIE